MPGKRLFLVAASHRHVTAGMPFSPNDAPSLELHSICEGSVSSGAGESPTMHQSYTKCKMIPCIKKKSFTSSVASLVSAKAGTHPGLQETSIP